MDIKCKLNLEEPANKNKIKLGTVYFTAFKKLIPNKVIFINTALANKAFNYLLILKDITELTLTTNPFIYILNIFSSQYTLNMFLGIIVNIKVNKRFTASYS